jgi:hypothetical protein
VRLSRFVICLVVALIFCSCPAMAMGSGPHYRCEYQVRSAGWRGPGRAWSGPTVPDGNIVLERSAANYWTLPFFCLVPFMGSAGVFSAGLLVWSIPLTRKA